MSDNEQARHRFEAWLQSFDGCADLAFEDGDYEDFDTQRAWAAWKAATLAPSTGGRNEKTGRLSDHPASPLPWRLQDAVIFDANGQSILGEVEGQPIEFPSEFDADYIFQAVQHFSQSLSSSTGGTVYDEGNGERTITCPNCKAVWHEFIPSAIAPTERAQSDPTPPAEQSGSCGVELRGRQRQEGASTQAPHSHAGGRVEASATSSPGYMGDINGPGCDPDVP